jgi:hypothetical protein
MMKKVTLRLITKGIFHECIGTSVAKGNQVAEKLYHDLNFIDGDKIKGLWESPW